MIRTAISALTWNLGYAGLGEESDFYKDGGRSRFAPSRRVVAKNLDGIMDTLVANRAEVMLLQEVTKTSPVNYWAPIHERIETELADGVMAFEPDVWTPGLPAPLRLEHGKATLAPRDAVTSLVPLSSPEPRWLGQRRHDYAMLVTRLPASDGREWVLANLHLSAFDSEGKLRLQQLAQVLAFAQAEAAKGNAVVLGGDWNLCLAKPEFAHQTEEKFLFWLVDFPPDALPADWHFAIDDKLPTVRTLQKRYVAGDNYTALIDGFLVSPNVVVEQVRTLDTGFAFSDHMPVTARFSLAP